MYLVSLETKPYPKKDKKRVEGGSAHSNINILTYLVGWKDPREDLVPSKHSHQNQPRTREIRWRLATGKRRCLSVLKYDIRLDNSSQRQVQCGQETERPVKDSQVVMR